MARLRRSRWLLPQQRIESRVRELPPESWRTMSVLEGLKKGLSFVLMSMGVSAPPKKPKPAPKPAVKPTSGPES